MKKETKPPKLFEEPELWKKEWDGMPEFTQDKLRPYATIIVRCETKEDLDEFARLIGQKLTNKTKSIWHPFKSHYGNGRKIWTDKPKP